VENKTRDYAVKFLVASHLKLISSGVSLCAFTDLKNG
jgi:hypothetical protein